LASYDQDGLEHEDDVFIICSTYTDGTPPPSAEGFFRWLEDLFLDFRVQRTHLRRLGGFAVLGLGSAEYDEDGHFCTPAENLHEWLAGLGARALAPCARGDDSRDLEKQFRKWKKDLFANVRTKAGLPPAPATVRRQKRVQARKVKEGLPADAEEDIEEDEEDRINNLMLTMDQLESDEEQEGGGANKTGGGMVDLEDLGDFALQHDLDGGGEGVNKGAPRPMATPLQRAALKKEGYKLIGTHSAVKLCRWTKNQLRGRGGCYKHTCYGITSYQCMEMTPSLACANKCVFCWRHHKNPVGKEWRWLTDPPEMIVAEGVEKHQKMINEARGIPGVKPERWEEAMTVKHCALSLVGEPIMYPRVNELLRELHARGISTFLVTNAQFPEAIRTLDPVTQLYVSIDAGTKEKLKAVDRPLFKDFWERYLASLRNLREKGQRTVYRLTLMKDCTYENTQEIQEYANLIKIGEPDLIEIKSVTYCGTSDASTLRMSNVLFHEEVVKFAKALAAAVDDEYDIASEHQHSLLVLLAKKKYKKENKWHTWIDYPKFTELMQTYYETGATFTAEDYLAPTPSWAEWGAVERGFDPMETRFIRNKDGLTHELVYQASESGCG